MLEPIDIRHGWNRIKDGLVELSKKCDWIPEDIYHSCKSGASQLWIAAEGFVILQIMTNEFTGAKELLVWIAVGEGFVQDKYLPQIEQIARSVGAKTVKMESPRLGFARKGWDIEKVTYSREVPL